MSFEKNKVVFYEVFEEEERALRSVMPEDIEAVYIKETTQESGHQAAPASVISVRTQSVVPRDWAVNLKGILSRSTGHDHLTAYRALVKKDIPCGRLPSYCSRAVAEQAVLMMLALWRKLPRQMKQAQTFSRDGLTGEEWLGKSVLIVGVGKIGSEIGKIAAAMGMEIKGVDIDPRQEEVEYVFFDEGAAWADAVISAVPLTEQTRNMFCHEAFRTMKPSAIFVNVSRGEVSPVGEILRALEQKTIAGAALDVYDEEDVLGAGLRMGDTNDPRIVAFHRLLRREDVVLTPHNAFNTCGAVERKAQQSARALSEFFRGGRFPHEFSTEC